MKTNVTSIPDEMRMQGVAEWRVRAVTSLLRTGKLKYCDVCGELFKPRDARNVYCGFACKQEANRYRAKMRKRRQRARRA